MFAENLAANKQKKLPASSGAAEQNEPAAGATLSRPIQRKTNRTGLPDRLKTGIETLSGHSMDDVKVHYNSSRPAQLNAHAYAQGTEIHLASGQERHLPHEAWHVVQQKQGRVKPTMQMKDVTINDDVHLEKEADVMGERANSYKNQNRISIQRKISFPGVAGSISPVQGKWVSLMGDSLTPEQKEEISRESNRIVGFFKMLEYLGRGSDVEYMEENRSYILGNESVGSIIATKLEEAFIPEDQFFTTGFLMNFIKETVALYIKSAFEEEGEEIEIIESDETDHGPEDGADVAEEIIDWSELTSQGLARGSELTGFGGYNILFLIFLNLADHHYKKAGVEMLSLDVLFARFREWMSSGVKTRAQFKRMIGIEPGDGDNTESIVQMARKGNTFSLNGNYKGTSNSFKYENVIYYRDGNGNIDFTSDPKNIADIFNKAAKKKVDKKSINWSNPQKLASEIQMSNDLSDKEKGIMPSGKKVTLKNASRSQHFSIADMLYPNSRGGTWTWHHLSTKYKMVLVDMQVHAKHGHNGGVYLWK